MKNLDESIVGLMLNQKGRKVCVSLNLKDGRTLNLRETVDHNFDTFINNELLKDRTKREDILDYTIIFE